MPQQLALGVCGTSLARAIGNTRFGGSKKAAATATPLSAEGAVLPIPIGQTSRFARVGT